MRKFTVLPLFICLGFIAFGQNAEEENIKKAIQTAGDAFLTRNIEAWKNNWQHDSKVSTTFISRDGYNTRKGWDSLEASIERDFKQNPKPDATQLKFENYTIRTDGNMAFVEYDLIRTPPDDQSAIFPYVGVVRFHNYDVLVKENDKWKISSRIVSEPASYNRNKDHEIESDLNTVGYELINAKKINDAIEVFRLNVKLYPDSWNTYDSLGEAYALAGNKKLAIENYEKSIKLNPKSELGPPALVKLKQK